MSSFVSSAIKMHNSMNQWSTSTLHRNSKLYINFVLIQFFRTTLVVNSTSYYLIRLSYPILSYLIYIQYSRTQGLWIHSTVLSSIQYCKKQGLCVHSTVLTNIQYCKTQGLCVHSTVLTSIQYSRTQGLCVYTTVLTSTSSTVEHRGYVYTLQCWLVLVVL